MSAVTAQRTIVDCLTTHSIVDVEQGRSFPLSAREAEYAAICLLASPLADLLHPDADFARLKGSLRGVACEIGDLLTTPDFQANSNGAVDAVEAVLARWLARQEQPTDHLDQFTAASRLGLVLR